MNVATSLRFLFLGLFWGLTYLAHSQTINVLPDSSHVEIGNPITIKFLTDVGEPLPLDLSEWLTIISADHIVKTASAWQKNAGTWQTEVTLIFFDSAQIVLPPLNVSASGGQTLTTPQLTIDVYDTPLPEDAQLAPIRDIIEAPPEPEKKSYLFIWLGLLAAVIAAIVWFYMKHKGKKTRFTQIEHVTPTSLEEIEKRLALLKRLIPVEPQKPFYDEMSYLLRSWLEHKYALPALEQTSHEINESLKKYPDLVSKRQQMMVVLDTADLVKFANEEPPLPKQKELLQLTINICTA
jgi:hypothetical protein